MFPYFYGSDQFRPSPFFKTKIFVLNTTYSLFTFALHFVVSMITHGYNTVDISMVEHSVTGANYCTGANYYLYGVNLIVLI